MGIGSEELARQQKQEEIRTEIRQQLPAQQTWNLPEGQTLQQRRDAEAMTLVTRQIEINETLNAQFYQMPSAQAGNAAAGTPDQTLKPAKKSWKERREDTRRQSAQAAEMQQHTQLGDHVTYAFAKAKQEINTAKDNSFPPEMRAQVRETSHLLASEHRVDVRILEVFVNGYQKNAKGEPLNQAEAQKKAQDEAFLQDYIASNLSLANGRPAEEALALRRPHLQRITHEMLNVTISEDMLTDEYLYEHAAEVMELADRFTCFINIMEEPTNQPFFDQELSQYEKDWLKARAASMEGFRQVVPHLVNVRGVKYNKRELTYMTDDDVEYGIPLEKANLQEQSLQFKENLKTDKEKQRKAASDEVERLRKELRGDDIEPLADTAGLQLLRELFLNKPEKYAAHKEELDRLYQQYYRAVDTLHDLTNDAAAYGQVVKTYSEATDIHRHLAQTALQKQMELEAQAQLIRQQMEAMADLMNTLLGGSPLTAQTRTLAQEEFTAQQAVEELIEELPMEPLEAAVEQLVHEAVLVEVQTESQTAEESPLEKIVEQRTQTLTFNQTTGGLGALTLENLPATKKSAFVPDQARYNDLLARREEVFFQSGKYGENLSSVRSHDGKKISGLGLRSLSLYGGSLGEGKTNAQLISMFEKLYVSYRYEKLKQKENANALTNDDATELSQYTEETLEQTFNEGMLEMKEVMYTHLCRLRDKYGRYPSQLHPKDLLAKLGPEFFNETKCVQDLMQFLTDGKAYFDFTTDKDREFRDLAHYYHSLSEIVNAIVGDVLNDGQIGQGLENFLQHTNFRESLKLEKHIQGPGFTEEEKAVYEEQAYQRMKAGELWKIDRFQIRHDMRHPRNPDITEIRRSRKDAISTGSDQRAAYEKASLKKLCDKQLPAHWREQNADVADLHASLVAYTEASRYDVGYTEERRLLKAAISKLKKAISKLPPEEERDAGYKQLAQALLAIQSKLADITTGELKMPNGADVLDFSDQQPTEVGTIQRGSNRNALIRKLSYWSDQRDTPLFTHSPTVNDLKQRTVSNCYMVASVAGLVHIKPHILKSCLKDNGDGTVTVRLYEKYESDETKAMKQENEVLIKQAIAARKEAEKASQPDDGEDLLDDFLEDDDIGLEMEIRKELAEKGRLHEIKPSYRPLYVKVSKEIPRIAGADALSAGALWMQMIEKACAFLGRNGVKGYQSLWYGEGGGFLERLLGAEPEKMEMSDDLFDEICTCNVNGYVFNAGTKGSVGKADGLNAGHAYTVMGGKWVSNKRYVLLRNPYSTMSMEHQETGTKNRTGQHLDTHSDSTYGQFYMDYETFKQKFDNVTRFKLP